MIYDSLCNSLSSLDNIRLAYKKARKGKGKKWYVKEFESNIEENLSHLHKELAELTYKPQSMKTFVIRDPKTRVISASHFRDRVVHHAICNVIEPIFERSFIYDSYANRKGKGTHAAIKRFDYFKNKVSQNGTLVNSAKDGNMVIGYFLKADIKRYFDSVNHEILMQIIGRKIKDDKVLWLIRKILNNNSDTTGMPIGNLTSQFFANVYLGELDYFVKHRLRAKYYIRYVDDFVILNASKERLEFYKTEIEKFLATVKLELHTEKSKIYPLHKGINFLGFRVFYYYKLPKKSNLQLIKQRIKCFIELYKDGVMSKDEIIEKMDGWNVYAAHGNTFLLRQRITKNLLRELRVSALTNQAP